MRFGYRPFIFAYNEFTFWCGLRGKPGVIKKLNLKAAAVSRLKCEAISDITSIQILIKNSDES